MAIGALQTGYTTLYGKIAGLGTQNGQTRGSSFREHDVITKVDGKKVDDVASLHSILYSHKVGDTVNVTVNIILVICIFVLMVVRILVLMIVCVAVGLHSLDGFLGNGAVCRV